MTTTTDRIADALIARGGKLWEGDNGARRVYLNNALHMDIAGYHVNRYGTGNISGVQPPDGSKLSNAKGGELVSLRVHFDIPSGRFVVAGRARAEADWRRHFDAAVAAMVSE